MACLGMSTPSYHLYLVLMQSFLETGYWHYKQTEEQVFARLKGMPTGIATEICSPLMPFVGLC